MPWHSNSGSVVIGDIENDEKKTGTETNKDMYFVFYMFSICVIRKDAGR